MGKRVTSEGNGWASVSWRHFPRSPAYKFKLVSESGQLVKIKHGTVYYG
ncbi:TPA: hypothetical protein QCR24_005754 [Bacillus cereus]|nr:hypothetical protein [Bacillus cereus]